MNDIQQLNTIDVFEPTNETDVIEPSNQTGDVEPYMQIDDVHQCYIYLQDVTEWTFWLISFSHLEFSFEGPSLIRRILNNDKGTLVDFSCISGGNKFIEMEGRSISLELIDTSRFFLILLSNY